MLTGAAYKRWRRFDLGYDRALLLVLVLVLAGCATYQPKVQPIPLPAESPKAVHFDGVSLIARAYVERAAAQAAFGYDARGAGVLPVRFVIDNQSGHPVTLQTQQTFLVDTQGQAWPVLDTTRATERIRKHVEVGETAKAAGKPAFLLGLAGAVAGAAAGVLTEEGVGQSAGKGAAVGAAAGAILGGGGRYTNLGSEVSQDLAREALHTRTVPVGNLGHGLLLFPGLSGEAESAKRLRLSVKIGERVRTVQIPF